MSEKYTLKQVAEIVDIEGLGYAIQCYTNGDNIADPELARLWDECAILLDRIESMLSTNDDEEDA